MTSVDLPPMIVSSPPSPAMTIKSELLNLVDGRWMSLPVFLSRSLPPQPPDPPDSSRLDIDSLQLLLCYHRFSLQPITTPPSHSTKSSPPLTGGKHHHHQFILISSIELSGTRSRGIGPSLAACFLHLHPRVFASHNHPLNDAGIISIISTGGGLPFRRSPALTVVSGPARFSSPEKLSRNPLIPLVSTNNCVGEVLMGLCDCKLVVGHLMSCSLKPSLNMVLSDFSGPFLLISKYRFLQILYGVERSKFYGFSNDVIYSR